MSRRLRPLAFAFPLLAVTTGAVPLGPQAPPAGPPPAPVRTATVEEAQLAPRQRVFGELRAARRTTVATEESGLVTEFLVREGSKVRTGDLLARLDGARIGLERAGNRASLSAAEATVVEREAAVTLAERTLELLRAAAADGVTKPREMLDAESAAAIARAQAEQARLAVEVLRRVGELLAERAADLEIRAPFAGTVVARRTEVGSWVGEGAPIAELAETASLEAWFDLPQELWNAMRGSIAILDSGGRLDGPPLAATLAGGETILSAGLRLVPDVDPRTRTFPAVLAIPNDDGTLAPGLALNGFVAAGASRRWTLVPKDALVYQGTNPLVYAVIDGRAVPMPVRIAFPFGDRVALEDGTVAAGMAIVVEGNERLMPNAAVTATERSR